MNHEERLRRCIDYIVDLVKKVSILNSINYYDINISSEKFFARLLGLVYGWNLKNMNYEENNTTAIDLCDEHSRIAIQVTSDSSSKKIHNTIEKFVKNSLYADYDRLVFLVIVEDKNYKAVFDTKGKFVFDKDKDIITCKKLIKDIRCLDEEKITKIYNYLSFEFDNIVNNDSVWTIEKADKYMSSNTDGVLTLDYFEIDDNEFVDKFNSAFEIGGNIFVKGNSREETLYCVLNLLKKNNVKNAVYIIKNKDDWTKFEKYIQDAILIPYFQSDEISAIKGNINIFIYGVEDYTTKNYITLRRRKMRTLEEKLKNYKDGDHGLIMKTNGLFPFVKRYLFEGHSETTSFVNKPSKSIIAGLLVGQWSECDGDKSVIEGISGVTYDEFIGEIGQYINIESPMFIKVSSWNANTYKLSDIGIFWAKYYDVLTDENKKSFYEMAENVILDKDPLFDVPFNEHVYGSIKAEKSTYSNMIKIGLLQSMIFLAINGEQTNVDRCVRNILSHVSGLNMWGYISQFSEQICEASPAAFLEKIEHDKDKDDFINLFKSEGDLITTRHYYTHILWALESLLRMKEYASRVVRLLMHLTIKIQKCAISNSPTEVLSLVFCSWLNLYSISFEEKTKLAEIGVEKYEAMWEIIFDVINSMDKAIMVSRATFDYRLSEDVTEPTYEDIYKLHVDYLNILRGKIDGNISRWIKLIDLFPDVPEDLFDQLVMQLKESIETFEDSDKEHIKIKLRKEIYRHRFFCKSNWAMSEERICKIEELCKSIKFQNLAYDFVYLFHPKYEFPIYNPTPMEENGRDLNEKLREEVIQEEFKRIKREQVDICEIIKLGFENKYTQMGCYIAQYHSEGVFDKSLYEKMLQINNAKNILFDYVRYTYASDNNIFEVALNLSLDYDNSDDLYVEILKLPEINEKYLEFICKQDASIQEKYFSYIILQLERKPSWGDIFIEKCLEFNCEYSLLDFLYKTKNDFSADELMFLLKKICEMPRKNELVHHEAYLIEQVIEYIQALIKDDFDKYATMCELEIKFFKILSWERMLCTQYLFKTDASLYAQLIELVFKKDEETHDIVDTNKQKTIRFFWDVYYNAKFCPGEINGSVDPSVLSNWVDTFEKMLSDQNQKSLFAHLLGGLFAYSPVGNDGYYPHELIRNIIEEKTNDSLKKGYYTAELNKRGVHTVDAGEGEKKLALYYQNNANGIRIEYPKTAEIYDMLSRCYFAEAKQERERAENGQW